MIQSQANIRSTAITTGFAGAVILLVFTPKAAFIATQTRLATASRLRSDANVSAFDLAENAALTSHPVERGSEMGWNPEDFASPEVKAEISRLDTAVTPSREMQHTLSGLERELKSLLGAVREGDSKAQLMIHIGGLLVDVEKAARLAAKPADEGVTGAVSRLEFARKALELAADRFDQAERGIWADEAREAAKRLSTTGEPKR